MNNEQLIINHYNYNNLTNKQALQLFLYDSPLPRPPQTRWCWGGRTWAGWALEGSGGCSDRWPPYASIQECWTARWRRADPSGCWLRPGHLTRWGCLRHKAKIKKDLQDWLFSVFHFEMKDLRWAWTLNGAFIFPFHLLPLWRCFDNHQLYRTTDSL